MRATIQQHRRPSLWRVGTLLVFLCGLAPLGSSGFATLAAATQSFGELTLLSVAPRVVTPNGDHLNDLIRFNFDSVLSGLPVETAVLDINGARVSGLQLDSNQTALTWDGKDDSGTTLPAGIYIYSIKIGKNQATGTVVIAR